jgi:hypothetical protein
MSDAIAVVGTPVAPLATDRQPANGHSNQRTHSEQLELPLHLEQGPAAAPQPPDDEPSAVLPGTLFSASQLGERLRTLEQHLSVLHRNRGQGWKPPESALRLKDKSI